jgi:hypothetical protein
MRWVRRAMTAVVNLLASALLKAFLVFAFILLALTPSKAAATSIFGNGFETPGSGGEDPPDFCTDPLINPAGFYRTDKTWTQTFSAPDGHPSAIYPAGVSFPTPVGAEIGHFRVVPFTPFQDHTVNLYWDQVQARPQDGYYRARPARSMFLAITPCSQTFGQIVLGSGDLRAPMPNAVDPFQRPGCREVANSASLIWTTDKRIAATSNDYVCVLEAGKPYWLIVAPVNPSDGLVPGEETCELDRDSGCDVGVRIQSGTIPKDAQRWTVRKAFGLPPGY